MLDIHITTIDDKDQRYDTVGDYIKDGEKSIIKVSEMKNRHYEFFVAVHELVEQFLCQERGINDKEITAFDIAYQKNRRENTDIEPGDSVKAPYHKKHVIAEKIEKLLVDEFGDDWGEYVKLTNDFYDKK